ncbi:EF-Tu C-terminal domain-related protein [Dyella koreensis]|uniref:EF-Tu C-terminal domain-related protein n=1 Tax=Dyella koreensis TaxID=311235 RepID=UPI00360A1E48
MSKAFGFHDVLEPNGSGAKVIRVQAKIHMLSAQGGGRTSPVTTRYRPNHNFGGVAGLTFYIGQFEVPGDRWVEPGETAELVVEFLNVVGIAELLQPGRRWRIQEGGKLVGEAEVISVL